MNFLTSDGDVPLAPRRGSVRVTNMRVSMAPDAQPEEDEVEIVIDRTNPILGNKHILYRKNDYAERMRVIKLHQRDVDDDLARGGPISVELHALAERVRQGERLCLACWCSPSPCHGDTYRKKIFAMAFDSPGQ